MWTYSLRAGPIARSLARGTRGLPRGTRGKRGAKILLIPFIQSKFHLVAGTRRPPRKGASEDGQGLRQDYIHYRIQP